MPIQYSIDVRRRLVLTRFLGTVTFEEIAQLSKDLQADARFSADFSELNDASNCEAVELNFSAQNVLAQFLVPFSKNAKRAIVVTSQVNLGSARMHQLLLPEPSACAVFKSLQEAMEWLGLDREAIPTSAPAKNSGYSETSESAAD